MVRLSLDQVDSEAALINIDQSNVFDRVYHRFLGTVLESAGFCPHFRPANISYTGEFP